MTPEQRERWLAGRTKHGAYANDGETPEHYVWRAMIARCTNPSHHAYHYYGAVGITVCKRWMDYKNFLADMGNRPSSDYSLDRIDTRKGYKPSNCRWATRSQQQKNKTTTTMYTNGTFTGTLVECAALVGISKHLAHWRFKTWGTFEKGIAWRKLLRNV